VQTPCNAGVSPGQIDDQGDAARADCADDMSIAAPEELLVHAASSSKGTLRSSMSASARAALTTASCLRVELVAAVEQQYRGLKIVGILCVWFTWHLVHFHDCPWL